MWPGLRLLEAELRDARDRGVPFRVVTTTYLGGTERAALDRLVRDYGAEVKVQYDARRTRTPTPRPGSSDATAASTPPTSARQTFPEPRSSTVSTWNARSLARRNPDPARQVIDLELVESIGLVALAEYHFGFVRLGARRGNGRAAQSQTRHRDGARAPGDRPADGRRGRRLGGRPARASGRAGSAGAPGRSRAGPRSGPGDVSWRSVRSPQPTPKLTGSQ